MAVERQRAVPTPAEMGALRAEAVRKRVLQQEWAGSAVKDLTKAVAHLHGLSPQAVTQKEHAGLIEHILCLCDQISVAAEVATASIHIAANERLELAEEISGIDAEIAREEAEVGRLRKVLEKERKQAERRAQYDALVKVILEEPEPELSQKQLDEAKEEFDRVEKELARVEEIKETMSKELSLFLHCASNLESFSTQFKELLGDTEETKAAMDTSS